MRLQNHQSALATLIALAVIALACPPQAWADAEAVTQYRKQRSKLAHRSRRIIFNNDGDDHLLDGEASVEAFLARRTTPLIGSQVDTIVYCTSRPFGMFTHNTRVGDVLVTKEGFTRGRSNIVADFVEQGTDPLEVMVGFCREHSLEVLWSMRMNDTHDVSHSPDRPHCYWSSFKEQHPEYLLGRRGERLKHGSWSAVDYAQPQVRDFVFRVFEEICRGYDVDGIELDFFRHLVLFKTVANGQLATDEERAMVTDLVRRVRRMTEAEGMRRGKPILLTMRAPDSVEFCRGMGLDVEAWMAEGLIDVLVAGGDFRLNRWEYSTELGAKYDVPVYADLDPSIPYGLSKALDRNSLAGLRGRALNAWSAGCAGIYMFNHFSPQHRLWWELGDPETLKRSDKLYFVNVTGGSGYLTAQGALPGGVEYLGLPTLHPRSPGRLVAGETLRVPLRVGERLAQGPDAAPPSVTCHVVTGVAEPPGLSFNGEHVAPGGRDGSSFSYPVPPQLVREGVNDVQVSMPEMQASDDAWDAELQCSTNPPAPWVRDRMPPGTEALQGDGGLLIADRSKERGSYLYYSYPWDADPARTAVVEARVKTLSGRSGIIVTNGVSEEQIHLEPARISLQSAGIECALDTADTFHAYRIEIKGSDVRVFVDGELKLDGTGKFTRPAHSGRNLLMFGASSSGTTGEALWESIRLRTGSKSLFDIVLSVDYPDEG